jgi:hypothetical protein
MNFFYTRAIATNSLTEKFIQQVDRMNVILSSKTVS